MVKKFNSLKVRNYCTLTECWVNRSLLGNNFIWDNSTTLSLVFIWEKNSGKPNNVIHSMYTKSLVLNLESLDDILEWDRSFDEFSNDITSRLPIFSASDLDMIEKELANAVCQKSSLKKNTWLHNETFGPTRVK